MSAVEQDGWYARRGSCLLGPYTYEELERYILLGRIRLSDRVSPDGHNWVCLGEREDLIPTAMHDLESPEGRAQFEEARRLADERQRRESMGVLQRLLQGERREDRALLARPLVLGVVGGVLILVVAALILLGARLDFSSGVAVRPDCDAVAGPAVDWSYCDLAGVRLAAGTDLSRLRAVRTSLREAELKAVELTGAELMYADLSVAALQYADLSGADLEGADLRGGNLQGALLVGASLRYADLRGVDLSNADITGADLTGAAWAEGEWCREGSIGRCVR